MSWFTRRRPTAAIVVGLGALVTGALVGSIPARAGADDAEPATEVGAEPDGVATVTCRLPAEVERRGGQVTHLGARREVRITREECAERGGEVVARDDGTPAEEEPDG